MFESLSDRIKEDNRKEHNRRERLVEWLVIAVVSLAVFAGLFYGVRMLQ